MMPDQSLKELDRSVRRLVRGEAGFTLDQLSEAVAEILIDETTLAVCFDVSGRQGTARGNDGRDVVFFDKVRPCYVMLFCVV